MPEETTATLPDTPEEFDSEAIYDEQIHPLMEQIRDICEAHSLPYFTVVVVGVNEKGWHAVTNARTFDDRNPPSILRLVDIMQARNPPSLAEFLNDLLSNTKGLSEPCADA